METLKYPCRKCSKEVEDGILCEGLCQSWYHASCVCVTDEGYDCLAASDDRWECPECVGDALPPHNSRDVMDVFHFNFQKSLPTPKITVGLPKGELISCLSHFIFRSPYGTIWSKVVSLVGR